jgi:hypothetical protein
MKKVAMLVFLTCFLNKGIAQGNRSTIAGNYGSAGALTSGGSSNNTQAADRNTYSTASYSAASAPTHASIQSNTVASEPSRASYRTPETNNSYYRSTAPIASAGSYGNNNFSAYNSSGYVSSPSGGALRYNYAAKKEYRCFSANDTKHKSHRHEGGNVRICRPPLPPAFWPGVSIVPYYYCIEDYENALVYDEVPQPERAAYGSFDGYIVYDRDTLSGLVTMDKHAAYLEQPINAGKEYASTARYDDKYLKAIVLFMGTRELHFARLADNDKRLWRVLHTGKLNIYDASYDFPDARNVNKSNLRIVYTGKRTPESIHGKKELIQCINKVYNVNLDPANYTWKALVAYIDELN